jgi:site-specific recombinase XerD
MEPKLALFSASEKDQRVRIYPVTEGIQSNQTAVVYERCFNHFMDHIKIQDKQVLLDFSPKVIKQMIVDYVLFLRDENKLSRASIKVHLSAILRFFQINNDDFNLTIRNFKLHLPSDDSIHDDRAYTVEEIGQVVRDCDLRSRVAILLLCSSGMRIGGLYLLRMCDLTKAEVKVSNATLYKVKVYAGTKDQYNTFTTPECYNAIQEYFEYRKRYGAFCSFSSSLRLGPCQYRDYLNLRRGVCLYRCFLLFC